MKVRWTWSASALRATADVRFELQKRTSLLAPLRRDRKSDFASGSGDELLRSTVVQVLMTEADTPRSFF